MKAIILAAGVGSRLAPLTIKKPKTLIEVCGKPILSWQIDNLLDSDIKDITICVGYKSKQIIDFCHTRYPHINFNFVVNEKYESTNNIYSLYLARHELNNDLFLMNGDGVWDKSIIIDMKKIPQSLIAVDEDNYLEESMKVMLDKNLYILDISKNITKKRAYGVSIDIHKFLKKDATTLREGLVNIVEKEGNTNQWFEVLLQRLFSSKKLLVKPFNIKNSSWYEIDTEDDLRQAELIFNDKLKIIKHRKI